MASRAQCVRLGIAVLITACSSTRYPTRDGSPPRDPPEHADSQGDTTSGDTSPSDGEEPGLDAAIIDGTATDASLDGDGGCACDHIPSGIPQIPLNGVLPLSCYCEGGWAGFGAQWPQCMTYDESVACHRDLRERATVITYENCNLVTLSYGAGLVFDQRHFDATTHAFVGARRWVDHPVPCGSEQVFEIRSGILPGDDCTIAKAVDPCSDPATRDAETDALDAFDSE